MTAPSFFAPISIATGEPLPLAMQRLWLTGQILPAGARLTVEHVFRSSESRPLEVIYSFPLPRDAALRSFRITGEAFEAHSELRPTEDAVRQYEAGIAQGSLSTLARTYGDGLVNLTLGNLRPNEEVTVHLELLAGVELRDDGFRFRFPFTLAPAYHPRARMVITAPGEGEIELPSNEFGDVILPRFRADATDLHQVGFDVAVSSPLDMEELASPSHPVRVRRDRVSLATGHDIPNRDLVLDARYGRVEPQVLAAGGHFAAIVPSTSFGSVSDAPRQVVILLDRSGSMEGAPLTQARKAIEACLAALGEGDSFGLIAFDDRTEELDAAMYSGSRANRDKARAFLQKIDARGGTELTHGFQKAVQLLGGRGGDVLILTDGQVSGTEEILAEARRTNTRLHCLGIGSASQDRFLALLARETGGVSRFVTAAERVDLPAVDLFASIGRPLVSGLKAPASVRPEAPAAVFSGTPVLLFGETGTSTTLALTWDGGSLSLPIPTAREEFGDAVRLLQGARLITDWESRYPAAGALASRDKRQASRVAGQLRQLSETYQLASREMSLVAVVKRAGDRPGELPDIHVVPTGMPRDTNFGAYFQSTAMLGGAVGMPSPAAMAPPPMPVGMAPPSPSPKKSRFSFSMFARGASKTTPPAVREGVAAAPTLEDQLLSLASSLDGDGGMPGKSVEDRAAASIAALFAFIAAGHTATSGAFRSHVGRLVAYLESLRGLPSPRQQLVEAALHAAKGGTAPAGDWHRLINRPGDGWGAIEKGLRT